MRGGHLAILRSGFGATKESEVAAGDIVPVPGAQFEETLASVLAEQNDEWTESRRYMGLEILAACRKAAQPDMGQNATSGAGLTAEAILLKCNRSRGGHFIHHLEGRDPPWTLLSRRGALAGPPQREEHVARFHP
jgi:hypothetical protein